MIQSDLLPFGNVPVDSAWKITMIRSVWYPELTGTMVTDAVKTLSAAGISADNIRTIDAPGSYEIPLLCQKALEAGADGIIAFGIVVQGATHHAKLVAEQAAAGCMQVQLKEGKPVIFEVLFVNTIEDAISRVKGPDAKGPLAAYTLLTQLAKLREMH